MHHKLFNSKVQNFRMWKSGKRWLFGASVLVALACGNSVSVLAQETGTNQLLDSGSAIEQTTVVQENRVSDTESQVDNLTPETTSETTATDMDLPAKTASDSLSPTKELSEEPSSTSTKEIEEPVLESKSQKSDEENQTPPTISENQAWTHGVSKPSKEELTWQKEYYQGYYTAPYKDGSHLFDVNKEYAARGSEFGLCSAGVAANMLHWWLVNNKEHVDKYLQESATNGVVTTKSRVIDLRDHKDYIGEQHKSKIFDLFKTYFLYRAVYIDKVLDLFFSGYPNASEYQVNQETDYNDKEEKGLLDTRGGFFKDVFEQHLLTSREDVSDYTSIGNKIKQALNKKKALAIDYLFKQGRGHAVTVWGAEFNENGHLKALYVTDTDDYTSVIDAKDGKPLQSLKRYQVVNRDGKAYISNNYDGTSGVAIRNLYTLDLGTKHWETYFSKSKEERDRATRKKIMSVVCLAQTKADLVEAIKRPWGGGFSKQDIELLQKIQNADFTDDEFGSFHARLLDILSVSNMQGDRQWDGRFPSPGQKLPLISKQNTLSESTPITPRMPEIPRLTSTQVDPKMELKPVTPNPADTPDVSVIPQSDANVHIGSKSTILPPKNSEPSTPELGSKPELNIPTQSDSEPTVPETPRLTSTQVGPKTELKSVTPNPAATSDVPVVPQSDSNVHVDSKSTLLPPKNSEPSTPKLDSSSDTHPISPRVAEIPRLTSTQVDPKMELKPVTPNPAATLDVPVVPQSDSTVHVGPKSTILPPKNSESSIPELGTKPELKNPTQSDSDPTVPDTPDSTSTQVGPKTELKSVAPKSADKPDEYVTPHSDENVHIGSKSAILFPKQAEPSMPELSTPKLDSPSDTQPISPMMPKIPRLTSTQVGPKTELKSIFPKSDATPDEHVTPQSDENVHIGPKSTILSPKNSEPSTPELGSKPELNIPNQSESESTIPSAPETSSSTQVGPKMELKSVTPKNDNAPDVPSIPHLDVNVYVGSKSTILPPKKEEPSTPELGTKPELNIPNQTAPDSILPSAPETSSSIQIGSKTELKSIASKIADTSDVSVVPQSDSNVHIDSKSTLLPPKNSELSTPKLDSPSDTHPISPRVAEIPRLTSTQVDPKMELKPVTPNPAATSDVPVVPQSDSNVHVDSKSTLLPPKNSEPSTPKLDSPSDTYPISPRVAEIPRLTSTQVDPKMELKPVTPNPAATLDVPVVPQSDSTVQVGPKSTILLPKNSEPSTPDLGTQLELKNPNQSESESTIPRVPETSSSTQVGPKTELKLVTPNPADTLDEPVIPQLDANVHVGSKSTILLPKNSEPSTPDLGTQPELKNPNQSEPESTIPRVPETSSSTQVGPKTELKSVTPKIADTLDEPVIPQLDVTVHVGSKSTILLPKNSEPSTPDLGTQPELKNPNQSEPESTIPRVPETSSSTQVGPKTELKSVTSKSDATPDVPAVPQFDATVHVGSKSTILPPKKEEPSTPELGTKPELKIPERHTLSDSKTVVLSEPETSKSPSVLDRSSKKDDHMDNKASSDSKHEMSNQVTEKNQVKSAATKVKKGIRASHIHYLSMVPVFLLVSIWGLKQLRKGK
ncbi:IdeS/Mac family cysteine endopeptidase [Streptococcus pneumoniae]